VGFVVKYARALETVGLALLLATLLPRVVVAPPPIPDQFGRVLDAATGAPAAGVRIVAIDSGSRDLGAAPRVVETLADSLGRYSLALWGPSWVLYAAPHYEPIRLTYPDELLGCDSCCGRLKDVRLEAATRDR
jgi:hypothetical protein